MKGKSTNISCCWLSQLAAGFCTPFTSLKGAGAVGRLAGNSPSRTGEHAGVRRRNDECRLTIADVRSSLTNEIRFETKNKLAAGSLKLAAKNEYKGRPKQSVCETQNPGTAAKNDEYPHLAVATQKVSEKQSQLISANFLLSAVHSMPSPSLQGGGASLNGGYPSCPAGRIKVVAGRPTLMPGTLKTTVGKGDAAEGSTPTTAGRGPGAAGRAEQEGFENAEYRLTIADVRSSLTNEIRFETKNKLAAGSLKLAARNTRKPKINPISFSYSERERIVTNLLKQTSAYET